MRASHAKRGHKTDPDYDSTLAHPNPRVAIHLRHELQRARAAGCTFEDSWDGAVQAAVEIVSDRHREGWVTVLAETREAWRRAYNRDATGACFSVLSVALIDVEPY